MMLSSRSMAERPREIENGSKNLKIEFNRPQWTVFLSVCLETFSAWMGSKTVCYKILFDQRVELDGEAFCQKWFALYEAKIANNVLSDCWRRRIIGFSKLNWTQILFPILSWGSLGIIKLLLKTPGAQPLGNGWMITHEMWPDPSWTSVHVASRLVCFLFVAQAWDLSPKCFFFLCL